MKEKVTRQFLDYLIQNINLADFMESEYDSYFTESKMSDWVNTNCPMPNHDDNSPSFGVNNTSNRYNCFGCGATGDIIKLVQEVEGLNFIEAIQKLSHYAGLELETTNLDLKYLVNEFNNSINSYLDKENNSNYPGGLSEIGFLLAFSDRTKKFLRSTNYDESQIKWIDEIYISLDEAIVKNDFKKIKLLWKDFSKLSKERLNEWKNLTSA